MFFTESLARREHALNRSGDVGGTIVMLSVTSQFKVVALVKCQARIFLFTCIAQERYLSSLYYDVRYFVSWTQLWNGLAPSLDWKAPENAK